MDSRYSTGHLMPCGCRVGGVRCHAHQRARLWSVFSEMLGQGPTQHDADMLEWLSHFETNAVEWVESLMERAHAFGRERGRG